MKTLRKIFFAAAICILPLLSFVQIIQTETLDYKKLGKGRLVAKDNSIKKNIIIHEIHLQTEDKAGWITYIKEGSLHDLLIEKIERIEFPQAEQGAVKMVFEENKVVISGL